MDRKREFTGVDIAKFIMAIFVVAIHTHPFEGMEDSIYVKIWKILERFAVPFFFIASGYFLFLKINTQTNKEFQLYQIKLYTKRIIQLYIYWTIIYLPITIWGFVHNDVVYYKAILLFVRGFFLIGENFYSWPLWYLLSMIYSLILIYILINKRQKIITIFFVALLLFLISNLIDFTLKYDSSSQVILRLQKLVKWGFENGRLFSGMLYIIIGALLVDLKEKIRNSLLMIFIMIGLLFQIYYFSFISPITFVFLPTVLFCVSLNLRLEKFNYGYFFRKCSTVIYFMHMIVFFLYTLIFKEFLYHGFDAFIVSIFVSILFTPIILKYEKKHLFLRKIF